MRNRVVRRAAASAAALLLIAAAAVYADVINADGDVVSPSAQTMISLGTVSPGATITRNIYFLLECRNTTHAVRGSVITMTPQNPSPAAGGPVSGGSISATPTTVGPVPMTWALPGQPCTGDPTFQSTAFSVVTIVAPTVVDIGYIFRIEYAKSPTSGLSGLTTMTFRFDVGGNATPVVTVPGPVTAEADTLGGWASSFTASAVDPEDGPRPTTCDPASGTVLAVGLTTVTCTAVDTAGATGSASFTVLVRDTTPPALNMPADVAVETEDPSGTAVSWTHPTAVDIVDGNVPVTCDWASGDHFPVGTTTVTCGATDAHGNPASATFSVSVAFIDRTAPSLSGVPAGISVETESSGGATVDWPAPTADDAVDGPVPVTCDPASGSTFAVGTTVVTCTASDAANNTATATFPVTVTFVDRTAPVLSGVPGNRAVNTENPSGVAVSWPAPTANDAVDGSVPVTCSPASGSTFAVGTTTVRCSASDAAGNTATQSFDVTVTFADATAPVMSGVPADQTVETLNPAGAAVTWPSPTAVDAVDGPVAVSCNPASGSTFAVGTTTVRCSASDAAGNATTHSFTVTVNLVVVPDGLSATWEGPGAGPEPFAANGRGTLPLKARFFANGVEVTPPAEPRLRLERLAECFGGEVVETVDGGAFTWNGDRWKINLKTGELAHGCWRVSVVVGDAAGGSFLMTVGHEFIDPSPSKAPAKKR